MVQLRYFTLAAGLLALCTGFVLHPPWSAVLLDHLDSAGRWVVALALVGALAARLLRLPMAVGVLLVAVLALMRFHGFAPVAATLLWLLASLGVGSLLLPAAAEQRAYGRSREPAGDSDSPWLALPIGGGLIAGTVAWLLPFPIFSQTLIAAALLLLVVLLRQRIGDQLRAARATLTATARECPAGALGLALVLLAASLPAWLPVISADDLASHLQIGWQLQVHGYYRMDVGGQVWSLAPWLADVAYGLLHLLGGAEAVAPLNMAWLALTAWLMVQISRRLGLEGALPWLAAMLYVSIPLVGGLSMSMQTETASAAATAALALLVLGAPAQPHARTLLAAATLAGLLLGMKILNVAFVAPLGVLLLWRWRFAVPWTALPKALLLGLLVAGASYMYAWTLTGNPVLPLFNGVFGSPWFPQQSVVDSRWLAGLDPLLPYWLSFRTGAYVEGSGISGAGGFVLLCLIFGAIGAALDRSARPLLLAGLAAWLIPMSQLQYLRYTLPALVLLIPALLVGVGRGVHRPSLVAITGALVLLQLVFQPSASWMLARGALATLITRGEPALLSDMAAERLVARTIRARDRADDRVLFPHPDHPGHAELAGQGFVANWYDHQLSSLLGAAEGGSEGWSQVAARAGANLVVVRVNQLTDELRAFLQQHAVEHLASEGALALYRLGWPQVAGETVVDTADKVALRFPPGLAGDRLVSLKLELACSQPHAPISLGWEAERPRGGIGWAHHTWIACPVNGRKAVEMVLAMPSGWGKVHLEAKPVAGFGPHAITLLEQGQVERPDLARERELSRVVRAKVCRRWKMCRELERPRILVAPA